MPPQLHIHELVSAPYLQLMSVPLQSHPAALGEVLLALALHDVSSDPGRPYGSAFQLQQHTSNERKSCEHAQSY